jgi:hypothetical protein
MARYWQAGSAVLAAAALACGCGANKTIDLVPDLPRDVARTGGGGSANEARSQKPEGGSAYHAEPPLTPAVMLGAAPERTAEVAGAPPAARIRATVNGNAILDEEIDAATFQARAHLGQLPEPEYSKKLAEILKSGLEQLIEREVVLDHAWSTLKGRNDKALKMLQEAASTEFDKQWLRPVRQAVGAKSEEEFQQFLRGQHLSLVAIKRHWERNFMAMEYMRNLVGPNVQQIGHLDVERYYNAHPEEFKVGDAVEWEDLLIGAGTDRHPTRDAARQFAAVLAERVRHGESIDGLKNFNDGESALNHGKGTGNKRGEVRPPECEPVLFQMKEGDVQVVETERAFHIVKLVRRQYAGQLPFDEKMQKEIRNKLRNDAFQQEMKRTVNRWRRDAIVIVAK